MGIFQRLSRPSAVKVVCEELGISLRNGVYVSIHNSSDKVAPRYCNYRGAISGDPYYDGDAIKVYISTRPRPITVLVRSKDTWKPGNWHITIL
jgi:hypothetical protein